MNLPFLLSLGSLGRKDDESQNVMFAYVSQVLRQPVHVYMSTIYASEFDSGGRYRPATRKSRWADRASLATLQLVCIPIQHAPGSLGFPSLLCRRQVSRSDVSYNEISIVLTLAMPHP